MVQALAVLFLLLSASSDDAKAATLLNAADITAATGGTAGAGHCGATPIRKGTYQGESLNL
jgi:hypothetical protein